MNKQDKQELRTNKQELISKYELIKNSYNFKVVATDDIISDLKRLDEPEKGYAEQSPQYLKNILARLLELPLHDREVWLKAIVSEFEQDFSRAWLDGYTVEKEKRYTVKFKGISENINCLNHNSKIQKWYLASNYETDIVRTKFTRKELEQANFGWVFDCPGIEVEEVQDEYV